MGQPGIEDSYRCTATTAIAVRHRRLVRLPGIAYFFGPNDFFSSEICWYQTGRLNFFLSIWR